MAVLAAETRLGPYEVLAPLGAGGMGEVYRARDTRLDRDVAIKVLPAAFATDADRIARFEREAKAVAALSHPNVLAIFDTGLHEGCVFVVTELLDGETLRDRLQAGPLPVRKSIDTAVQISRGLAAAHDKGIVHRDLKPENLFLLKDGQVKILDFGLAKSAATGSGATQTVAAITDAGSVMGTVGYMAPEQVRGQTVDARGDLFALGAVLYEMLSGRRAFHRDTVADTMSAILTADPPDLASARPDLAPALDRIVRHCLEKNPNERFQTARDVAFALEAFSGRHVGSATHTAPHIAPARRWLRVAAIVVFGLVLVAAGIFIDRTRRPPPSVISFETKTWNSEWITNARFAPDGQTIVFSAAPTGNLPQLFAIRPGSAIAQPFGDAETHLLSVSRTGELAVLTGARLALGDVSGTLARIPIDGAARAWMQDVVDADWSPDGLTLAIVRLDAGKFRLEYPIGQVLVQSTGGYLSDIRVSPDGSRVAFFDHPIIRDDRGWLRVVDRAGKVTTLAGEYRTERGLAWSPDGGSIFFSASNEGAWQPLVVNASGTPVVRPVLPSADGMQVLDVAADGRMLILRAESRQGLRGLLPGETDERDFSWLDISYTGTLSADGRHLVFGDANVSAGMNYAVALRDIRTGKVVRLGEGIPGPISSDGQWAPALIPSTGDMVFYPTGIGEPRKLLRGPIDQYTVAAQLLPDSRTALFCGNEKGKAPRCYVQSVPSGTPTPVTPEGTSSALLATDGRTLLLGTTAGTYEVATIGGGSPVPAKGLRSTDIPLGWTTDRRGVLVHAGPEIPARIDRVDPATGVRTTVKMLAPPDRAGVTGVQPHQWIDDGRGYVYSYQRVLTKLFVATGVK